MRYALLIGRILFVIPFLMFGFSHFADMGNMAEYAASKGVPMTTAATIITGVILVVAGLMVLLGYKAKIGGILLVVFLIPTAFIMHDFWAVADDMQAQTEMVHFLKNISMAGAALFIYYFGSGPLSLDARRATASAE